MKIKLLLTFFILFSAFHWCVFSQSTKFVGINLNTEFSSNENWRLGTGLTFDHQLTQHIGYETGIFYKNDKIPIELIMDGSIYNKEIVQDYLFFPVLFKYYSKFLNYSAGAQFDYFVGWHESKSSNYYENWKITSVDVAPKFEVGLLFKISKMIKITDNILIEPECKYLIFIKSEQADFGIGVNLKYRF
jgi:hypothetical protein